MKHEKLVSDLKTVLDSTAEMPGEHIQRQLRIRRQEVFQQLAGQSTGSFFSSWQLPAMVTLTAVLVISALIFLPNWHSPGLAEMASLPQDELEMLSTMDFDELEEVEFYDWLDMQDDQA